jgi:hypothetical protein
VRLLSFNEILRLEQEKEYTKELSTKHYFLFVVACVNYSAEEMVQTVAAGYVQCFRTLSFEMNEAQTEFLAHKSRGPLYSPAFDGERNLHCNLSRATSLNSA